MTTWGSNMFSGTTKSNNKLYVKFRAEKMDWICPFQSVSCHQKFHCFYLPRGLFGKSPAITYKDSGAPNGIPIRRSCPLYHSKIQYLFDNKLIKRIPKVGEEEENGGGGTTS